MRQAVVLLFVLLSAHLVIATEPIVKKIDIEGLRRIDEYAVRNHISQKLGDPLAPEKVSNDIKEIFRMNYFDDVRVEMEFYEGGIRLIYILTEKPTIATVSFYGNKEYDDDKLREQIAISRGSIADATLIQENALKIKSFYESEGYWLAQIVPVVKKIRETDVVITYLITEHEKVKIGKIDIEGNRVFSDGDIKDEMKTSEWWLFSFITSGGYYNSAVMRQDIESIKNLYFNNGYINVRVSEPEIIVDEKDARMTVRLHVSEGRQYSVASVGFASNKAYATDVLEKMIGLKVGEIFRRNVLNEDIRVLTDYYSERGYALVSIDPEIVPVQGKDEVNVTYNILEGDIYHIGRIEIGGNTKTRDKVIRREIRLNEGDKFNSALIKRSYQRLNNLNYFETVQLQPKPRVEEKLLDLDVHVQEKSTGTVSVGAGYSTVDKFVGMVDVTQANLFGTGRYIKLKGEFGSTTTTYDLTYTDPWFLDKELSFSASLYKRSRDYSEYDWEASGFSLGLGKALAEYWRGTITYSFEFVDISSVEDDAPQTIKDNEGQSITSSISPSIIRDTRDYYLDPHEGSKNALYMQFAGLGGDNKYVKNVIDSQWFFPLGPTTFAVRGRVGYADGWFGGEIPDYEGFFVGGINTVRGLGYGDGNPKDRQGDPIGGEKEIIVNFEFIFPILPSAHLKGVVFNDWGRAFGEQEDIRFDDIRYTVGTGIRW
ncbi:MAG: outer membrane protein assembly factor BamA, partial [Thermodesulfovibrionales bacterium]